MGKIKRMLKSSDIADMGIGAMIVFIAMVLVAGIAASVLIQTANKLEIQAMTTGDETINQVSTGLSVSDITGHKNGAVLNYAYITVQPRAGAGDIDLAKTYIEISNSAKKCVLTYTSGAFNLKSAINGDMFTAGFYTGLSSLQFGVIVLEDADSSMSNLYPIMNQGDKAALTMYPSAANGFSGFAARTDVWGMVQPEEGSPGVFAFTTPASLATTTVFDLY
jgi:flagellin FlaB